MSEDDFNIGKTLDRFNSTLWTVAIAALISEERGLRHRNYRKVLEERCGVKDTKKFMEWARTTTRDQQKDGEK